MPNTKHTKKDSLDKAAEWLETEKDDVATTNSTQQFSEEALDKFERDLQNNPTPLPNTSKKPFHPLIAPETVNERRLKIAPKSVSDIIEQQANKTTAKIPHVYKRYKEHNERQPYVGVSHLPKIIEFQPNDQQKLNDLHDKFQQLASNLNNINRIRIPISEEDSQQPPNAQSKIPLNEAVAAKIIGQNQPQPSSDQQQSTEPHNKDSSPQQRRGGYRGGRG